MKIVIVVSLILTGALLSWFVKFRRDFVNRIAWSYIYLSILVGLIFWTISIPKIQTGSAFIYLKYLQEYCKYIFEFLLGFLMAYCWQQIVLSSNNVNRLKQVNIAKLTRWGTSIYLGNTFIIATAGKMQNFIGISDFFKSSGYTLWFLYFIMTVETLGGVGIFLHYKLKTGIWASLGLIMVMIGAIVTHSNNKDPFSDSYAAVIMLIILILLELNYYFEKKAVS